jgi:ribosomal protein L32
MSTPTQKTSRSRRGSRRAHHKLGKIQISIDAAGNAHLPHHASPVSGKYKGKAIVDVAKRAVRKSKKRTK